MTPTATAIFLPQIATDDTLAPDTRLWIYLAERPLTDAETGTAQAALNDFAHQWTAHNQALLARAEIFQNQIVILAVDESRAGASGCSIDKSVHFLEALGQQLHIDFLEKMRFAWLDGDRWQVAGRAEFAALVAAGKITADTPAANTLVATKKDLSEKWALPYGQSWHRRLFP